ncbi:Protein sevenless [Schistosoma japonicum]|uniref:receptor protein-tyrosine kinase n=2 Tax=Schistosoma japonicum TaxID=6182 RepID=A0A4Z2D9R8_SCHJA|nr:Protein sevenless [Schistosoma japonicum]
MDNVLITTTLATSNVTLVLITLNRTEVDNFQFPEDEVPKPPLLIVKPLYCHSLPGQFILKCYRREIHFTWIPPDNKIAKAMVKFREFHQPKFTTMSDYGWGHSGVKYRNHTITALKPNKLYEFGLNLIYENSTFDRFPKIGSKDTCACKTYPDVPDAPLDLRYHYIHSNQYTLEWTPNNDNGEPIFTYNMKSMPIVSSNTDHPKWDLITPHNLTDRQATITLDTNHQSAFQLRAVNKIGMRLFISISTIKPSNKLADLQSALDCPTTLISISDRITDLSTFNPARRLHSSSGNGSSILGLGSDLTTSGLPLDLATLEPLWNQEVNSLYGISKPDLNNFEQVPQIPAANIRFLRYIGCGAFGKVWEGWLHVRDVNGERFEKVALKVRNCKSLTEAEFKREATLMHKYQHTNIVRFFGVSFDSPGQQCLVLEMMDQGNLRDYLHRSRPRIAPDIAANVFAAAAICAAAGRTGGSDGSSMNTSTTSTAAGGGTPSASNVITLTAQLDLPALVTIMRDICQGCRYLEEQHFVHRDIAARNCLVSHNHSAGRIVKLCDFGLARDIYKNDYYRKRNEPKLPVRWMSPEAIRDGLFTTKSDVWAYAVTCWEVLTLGADPFYGRPNVDVMNLVIGGHVLGRPENCPEELYNQLLQCWSRFTEMRPTFGQLCKKMDDFIMASQNSQSPFAQPFVVSLPLPKSLQGESGQRNSIYGSNKPQHHESNDLSLCMLPNNCQRRTSLDCGRPVSDMDSSLINETNLSQGMSSSKQLLLSSNNLKQSTFHTKSRSYAETVKPGYIVTPGVEGISMNKFNYLESRIGNQIYTSPTAPLAGAYECSMSDPSTEQTTLATTSNGTESNRQASIKQKPRSIQGNTDSVIDKMAYSGNPILQQRQHLLQQSHQPFGQPQSANFCLDTLLRNQNDSKTNSYKTLGYQDGKNNTHINKLNTLSTNANKSDQKVTQLVPFAYNQEHTKPLHSKSFNSKSTSMMDTMPHSSGGSTNNRSLTAYWLMETGGGVDSLGYERPSLIRTSFPSQTNSVNSHGESNSNDISTFIDQTCDDDFVERVISNHQSLRKTTINPLKT